MGIDICGHVAKVAKGKMNRLSKFSLPAPEAVTPGLVVTRINHFPAGGHSMFHVPMPDLAKRKSTSQASAQASSNRSVVVTANEAQAGITRTPSRGYNGTLATWNFNCAATGLPGPKRTPHGHVRAYHADGMSVNVRSISNDPSSATGREQP